ncbi:protein DEHYDRATION-INDUCED 19 homolog 7-like isoform X1 [Coffea arabica]|uniref:Protein DEHYDRATION-INDUCED 19 homolog 7-like isoform X1 n=1 Tax=Coffea arabica TaxID=13443 RepID=A0A6P6WWT2_COFAR|nr:protein DEHYDRATION-INDUCED 19 homolog 7-like isoform X1 [Coffea arabica]
MDSDSWIRIAPSSRRFQSRSDVYNVGEEYYQGGEEELRPEFLCPFCAEDFDIVGLCCHIDEEHAVEAKNGVCPVCAKRVGIDLIDHVTIQHGNLLKVQRKRRYRRGGSGTPLSILKRELREGNFQSLLGGSSSFIPSSTSQPDSLLSSFICNPPAADEPLTVQPFSSSEARTQWNGSAEDLSERSAQPSRLSEKDQEERGRKCEFVQGLLLSTFVDDDL